MNFIKYLQKDSILIKDDWEENKTSLIQVMSANYKQKKNYITKVVEVNYNKERYSDFDINKGDLLFLSRYTDACKKHKLEKAAMYKQVPMLYIIGKFTNNRINFDELEILGDKILVEKVDLSKHGNIILPDLKEGTVGRVVKTGNGGFLRNWTKRTKHIVEVGDTILFWNNVSTPLCINGREYLAMESNVVLGKFDL